ncbi:DUF4286 family protein [Actinokineospora globicatena]|uniref:DUF4286 domain-containing protein n=1 Tax=Actinokineospora globicatena TaxID=103729 RepID=A0A9W6V8X8_9PSEU|nr:DUF4286 family protein [Actinokineospora globicatena]GLW90393.1 hypothetical protein Aglo03_12090 [Actinokineospora globicatena]
MTVIYAVRVQFTDEAVRDNYLRWITDGHAAAVVAAGARTAEVLSLADGALEMRYAFTDRAALAAYESGPAIALRAEVADLFPPDAFTVTRSTGEIVARFD